MKKIILLFLVFSSFSCATTDDTFSGETVGHVVLIWLKEPGNQEQIEKVISATKQLKEITEIKQLHVGESIPSDRKIVDASFDVGIYMTFETIEDMQSYLIHPKHKKTVSENIKPYASKVVVYDISI